MFWTVYSKALNSFFHFFSLLVLQRYIISPEEHIFASSSFEQSIDAHILSSLKVFLKKKLELLTDSRTRTSGILHYIFFIFLQSSIHFLCTQARSLHNFGLWGRVREGEEEWDITHCIYILAYRMFSIKLYFFCKSRILSQFLII